mmetsp:Transcript_14806/g.29588  ORF Transcript_14806/g.29588 Transcript_14806/m.29588 type:complete len:98 (-) Transcript_14806:5-298(-)
MRGSGENDGDRGRGGEISTVVLTILAALLDLGPLFFFVVGAGAIGAEGALAANWMSVPVIDVPAENLAGVLLVPLSAVMLGDAQQQKSENCLDPAPT